MSYATVEDVRDALAPGDWSAQDQDPVGPTGTAADLTRPQLQRQLDEASSIVDAYIGGRYTVPVAPLDANANPLAYPAPVPAITRDIAAYYATASFRKNQNIDATDPVQLRYNAAMDVLKSIRDGKATFPGLEIQTGEGTTSGSGDPYNPYVGNLFGQDVVNSMDLTGPLYPSGYNPLDGHWHDFDQR